MSPFLLYTQSLSSTWFSRQEVSTLPFHHLHTFPMCKEATSRRGKTAVSSLLRSVSISLLLLQPLSCLFLTRLKPHAPRGQRLSPNTFANLPTPASQSAGTRWCAAAAVSILLCLAYRTLPNLLLGHTFGDIRVARALLFRNGEEGGWIDVADHTIDGG